MSFDLLKDWDFSYSIFTHIFTKILHGIKITQDLPFFTTFYQFSHRYWQLDGPLFYSIFVTVTSRIDVHVN